MTRLPELLRDLIAATRTLLEGKTDECAVVSERLRKLALAGSMRAALRRANFAPLGNIERALSMLRPSVKTASTPRRFSSAIHGSTRCGQNQSSRGSSRSRLSAMPRLGGFRRTDGQRILGLPV